MPDAWPGELFGDEKQEMVAFGKTHGPVKRARAMASNEFGDDDDDNDE